MISLNRASAPCGAVTPLTSGLGRGAPRKITAWAGSSSGTMVRIAITAAAHNGAASTRAKGAVRRPPSLGRPKARREDGRYPGSPKAGSKVLWVQALGGHAISGADSIFPTLCGAISGRRIASERIETIFQLSNSVESALPDQPSWRRLPINERSLSHGPALGKKLFTLLSVLTFPHGLRPPAALSRGPMLGAARRRPCGGQRIARGKRLLERLVELALGLLAVLAPPGRLPGLVFHVASSVVALILPVDPASASNQKYDVIIA